MFVILIEIIKFIGYIVIEPIEHLLNCIYQFFRVIYWGFKEKSLIHFKHNLRSWWYFDVLDIDYCEAVRRYERRTK